MNIGPMIILHMAQSVRVQIFLIHKLIRAHRSTDIVLDRTIIIKIMSKLKKRLALTRNLKVWLTIFTGILEEVSIFNIGPLIDYGVTFSSISAVGLKLLNPLNPSQTYEVEPEPQEVAQYKYWQYGSGARGSEKKKIRGSVVCFDYTMSTKQDEKPSEPTSPLYEDVLGENPTSIQIQEHPSSSTEPTKTLPITVIEEPNFVTLEMANTLITGSMIIYRHCFKRSCFRKSDIRSIITGINVSGAHKANKTLKEHILAEKNGAIPIQYNCS